MKRFLRASAFVIATTAAWPAVAQDGGQTKADAALVQKASYCIGVSIGRDFKDQGLELDSAALIEGLRDSITGSKIRLTEEEIDKVMDEFRAVLVARQKEKALMLATKNKEEGAAFLAANATKAGVKTTPSGLQIQILAEGNGPAPKASDTVKVHYRGTLIDGTEFDSSYDRGEPAVFPLSGVIKGWTEGLQLIKVGGKARLFIPAELAYGENPRPGGPIGPNAVLVFDVELLGIEK